MTTVPPITVPVTPVIQLPAIGLPPKTPKWLIHAVASAVAVVPILLALWQPRGAFTTPAAQAAIVLVGLLGAVVIFVATIAAENVAHYGLTKASILATLSTSEAELKQLLPEAKDLFATAKPLVDQLGGANDLITGLQGAVADVQAKLAAVPAGQRQAAIDALTGLLATTSVGSVPSTTTYAPAPVVTAPVDPNAPPPPPA